MGVEVRGTGVEATVVESSVKVGEGKVKVRVAAERVEVGTAGMLPSL